MSGNDTGLFAQWNGAIRARLDPFAANRTDPQGYRLAKIREFLRLLNASNRSLSLEMVAAEIGSMVSGAFAPGSYFPSPDGRRSLARLSTTERQALEEILQGLVQKIRTELPELVDEFPEQFPRAKVA
jgi:hypothetical protein